MIFEVQKSGFPKKKLEIILGLMFAPFENSPHFTLYPQNVYQSLEAFKENDKLTFPLLNRSFPVKDGCHTTHSYCSKNFVVFMQCCQLVIFQKLIW